MKLHTKAFTLVEVMLVVSILGLVGIIAIPNAVRARETAIQNACQANAMMLSNSLERVALETDASTVNLSEAELEALLVTDYIRIMPDCKRGVYSTDADGVVHCSSHNP